MTTGTMRSHHVKPCIQTNRNVAFQDGRCPFSERIYVSKQPNDLTTCFVSYSRRSTSRFLVQCTTLLPVPTAVDRGQPRAGHYDVVGRPRDARCPYANEEKELGPFFHGISTAGACGRLRRGITSSGRTVSVIVSGALSEFCWLRPPPADRGAHAAGRTPQG